MLTRSDYVYVIMEYMNLIYAYFFVGLFLDTK